MSNERALSPKEQTTRAFRRLLCIVTLRQAFGIDVCLVKVAASFRNRTLPPFCSLFFYL